MIFDVSFCNSCNRKVMTVAFLVLQGSVARYLTCAGKHDKSFIANFLLTANTKEF